VDQSDLTDQWDNMDLLDHRAAKDLLELPDLLASLDQLDPRAIVALQEDLASADFLDFKDRKVQYCLKQRRF
jgi:hypothetical protein